MTNRNITHSGIRTTGLGVVFGSYSFDSQQGGTNKYPANVGCFFKYKQKTNKVTTRIRLGKTTNLYFNVILEATQHKEAIEKEFTIYKTTSQRLADQENKIVKTGWFSDLKILEICQQVLSGNMSTSL